MPEKFRKKIKNLCRAFFVAIYITYMMKKKWGFQPGRPASLQIKTKTNANEQRQRSRGNEVEREFEKLFKRQDERAIDLNLFISRETWTAEIRLQKEETREVEFLILLSTWSSGYDVHTYFQPAAELVTNQQPMNLYLLAILIPAKDLKASNVAVDDVYISLATLIT